MLKKIIVRDYTFFSNGEKFLMSEYVYDFEDWMVRSSRWDPDLDRYKDLDYDIFVDEIPYLCGLLGWRRMSPEEFVSAIENDDRIEVIITNIYDPNKVDI